MEYRDYYQILDVERSASADQIKRSYRRLARKYHPDVSKESDAESRFKELGEAYEVLRDPEKRAAYDQLGSNYRAGQEFHPPPDWNSGFEQAASGTEGDFGNSSDFFEALFGAAAARGGGHRAAPGRDQHARVLIDLKDAYQGATRTIHLQIPQLDENGRLTLRDHQLQVQIPAGVRAGQQIRLVGQGGAAFGESKAGDLYLEIGFQPNSHYRVEFRDVYMNLSLAPWEAALGATITLPTPSGAIELKVPPGSQSGRKLRLKGRGIPGNPAGDLYAVLQLQLPAADDPSSRAAYQAFADHFATFAPRANLESSR